MVSVSSHLPGWVRGLVRRFRAALDHLVGVMPLTIASISVRPQEHGPLEVLATYRVEDAVVSPASDLVIGDAAVRWLDANRRELVLEVRPTHRDSEFYQSFIGADVKRALVVPVFQAGAVAGTVTVASEESDAYTVAHLKLVRLLAGELAPYFPRPAPVAPAELPTTTIGAPTSMATATEPERVDVDAALRSGEAASLRSTSEAVIEADALGRLVSWEGAAEGIFGLARRDVLGGTVAFFHRPTHARRIHTSLVNDLLAGGHFRGRALCYDSEGLPLTCEVELLRLDTDDGRVRGFRGRFRPVTPETLLPREDVQFDFAKLYAFGNRLANGSRGKPRIHADTRG